MGFNFSMALLFVCCLCLRMSRAIKRKAGGRMVFQVSSSGHQLNWSGPRFNTSSGHWFKELDPQTTASSRNQSNASSHRAPDDSVEQVYKAIANQKLKEADFHSLLTEASVTKEELSQLTVTVTITYPDNIDAALALIRLAKEPLETEASEDMVRGIAPKRQESVRELLKDFVEFQKQFPSAQAREVLPQLNRNISESKAVGSDFKQTLATQKVRNGTEDRALVNKASATVERLETTSKEIRQIFKTFGQIDGAKDDTSGEKLAGLVFGKCQQLAVVAFLLTLEAYTVDVKGPPGLMIRNAWAAATNRWLHAFVIGTGVMVFGGAMLAKFGLAATGAFFAGAAGLSVSTGASATGGTAALAWLGAAIGTAVAGWIVLVALAAALTAAGVYLAYLKLKPKILTEELMEAQAKMQGVIDSAEEERRKVVTLIKQFESLNNIWISMDGPSATAKFCAEQLCTEVKTHPAVFRTQMEGLIHNVIHSLLIESPGKFTL